MTVFGEHIRSIVHEPRGERPRSNGADFADHTYVPPGSPDNKPKRFGLVPFSDIVFSSDEEWLVKGLMGGTGLVTIYGKEKEYKSFVSLDLALHIAQGLPWAGRKVRQGAVVYICAEGASGFCNRVAANRIRSNLTQDLPFFLIKAKPNLGIAGGDTVELIAEIDKAMKGRGLTLAAVFIDTLVRTLAGSSENDEGMRCFTDNAEIIADHFNCAAIAIHHIGKDATRGMRGSSALPAAVVTSWHVEKLKKFQAQITLANAKDGESGLVWTAELDRYVFGRDEDGDERSVLVIREVSEPAPEEPSSKTDVANPATKPPPQLRLFMSCLAAVTSSGSLARPYIDGPEVWVVPLHYVRDEYCARRGDEASDDAKRKAFDYCVKNGLDRKIINVEQVGGEKVVWETKAQ